MCKIQGFSFPSLLRYFLHPPTARLCLIRSLIFLFDALLVDFTLHMRFATDLVKGKDTRSSLLIKLINRLHNFSFKNPSKAKMIIIAV